MARTNRRDVIDETRVGIYHCRNQCVRRAYLCGYDYLTERSYEHRKFWVQNQLAYLAGQFGIDVLAFAIMSNHLHVILRNRPDVVANWSDEQVARRWWFLFPRRRDDDGNALEPTREDLQVMTDDPQRMEVLRGRLSSISWFMRCWCEPIAHMANAEDECFGRFFAGRFRCTALLDDPALLSCMPYIDLNVIRAAIATTPESSFFTSIFGRIKGFKSRDELLAALNQGPPTVEAPAGAPKARRLGAAAAPAGKHYEVADFISPLSLDAPEEHELRWGSDPDTMCRASNTGCLQMTLTEYIQLVDWMGRIQRRDKRGKIPDGLPPILDRLGLTETSLTAMLYGFREHYRTAAGCAASLKREAERRGKRWLQGIGFSQQVLKHSSDN